VVHKKFYFSRTIRPTMTAVVGILNQQAAAIAADSAVTVTGANGRKIFNQANKVFTLSKIHPVGVMIYNSASLMGVPWETIIKIYRTELGSTSHNSLEDYCQHFIEFLHERKFFVSEEDQLYYYEGFFYNLLREVIKEVLSQNRELHSLPNMEMANAFFEKLSEFLSSNIKSIQENHQECVDFKRVPKRQLLDFLKPSIEKAIAKNFTELQISLNQKHTKLLEEFFITLIKYQGTINSFTGLIFTGFGNLDIYPKLIPLNISLAVKDRLKYFVDESQKAIISQRFNSAIRPFAQTDVIDTILSGVAPHLEATFLG